MKHQLNIEIGDVCCAIETEKSALLEELEFKYQGFISQQEPILTINIKQGEYRNQPEVKSIVESRVFALRWGDINGEINLEEGKGWVNGVGDFYSFDSFLRIVYSLLAVKWNGFLVHSVGVIKNGKGYIFAGPSESGKTTIARLSSNYNVISDEIIMVKENRAGFEIAGTPFYGELEKSRNMKAKIGRMFLLKRGGNGFYRRKLISYEATAGLLKNVLFFTSEPYLTKRLLELCSGFCRETRCEEIDFLPNDSFWRWIDDRVE